MATSVWEALAPYGGMRDVTSSSGRTVNDVVNAINGGCYVKNVPDTIVPAGVPVIISGDQPLMLPQGIDGPYIPVPDNVQIAFGEEGAKYTTSPVTLPSNEALLYDKNGNFITGVTETQTPGVYTFQTVNNDGGLNVYFGANPQTGQTLPITNPEQIQFTPSHGLGGITGVVRSFSEATGPIAQIAMAIAAPGVGSLISEGLAGAGLTISETAANAIGKAALSMAAGQDPASAIQDAVTSVVVQTGSTQLAKEVQDGVKAISDDKQLALLVAGAAGGAIASAAITAAKGGSQDDVVNAALAGAVGSGVATETDSRALGQAVAGGLTGGAAGAITGGITGQLADDKKAATATAGGGVPLPPGGKVGVTFSVDGAGNALVMYQDGTTATVQVDPSVQPGASVTVDPTTNVATVGAPSAVTTGGEQVAGPGGVSAQTVASMPEMQPRQGETAGDVTVDSEGVYSRTITSIQPDGSKTSYTISYDPQSPSGQQIFYPGGTVVTDAEGNVVPGTTATSTISYTRPDTEAAATAKAAYQQFIQTGSWPAGVLDSPAIQPYYRHYIQTGSWPLGVLTGTPATGQVGAETGVPTATAPPGTTGGVPTAGAPPTPTQEITIPEQITQVPGAGAGTATGAGTVAGELPPGAPGTAGITGAGTEGSLGPGSLSERDREILGLIGAGGPGAGVGAGEAVVIGAVEGAGAGAGSAAGGEGAGPGAGAGAGGGVGGEGEGVGGTELVAEEPPPEEVTPAEEPARYLISGGVSPKVRARAPTGRAAATALQTPFTSSLITSGLTSYRGAGEIESPESGKRRSNVWNEASLRLKDALGI